MRPVFFKIDSTLDSLFALASCDFDFFSSRAGVGDWALAGEALTVCGCAGKALTLLGCVDETLERRAGESSTLSEGSSDASTVAAGASLETEFVVVAAAGIAAVGADWGAPVDIDDDWMAFCGAVRFVKT